MPSKVNKTASRSTKGGKATDNAVELFRKEVSEQERLVDALKAHRDVRAASLGRIKELLACGSELAVAVGAWEVADTPTNKVAARTHVDPTAASSAPQSPPAGSEEAVAGSTRDTTGDPPAGTCTSGPSDPRVSEMKLLAEEMLLSAVDEVRNFMEGMDAHRQTISDMRRLTVVVGTEFEGEVVQAAAAGGAEEAEEEAALQELAAFRQRVIDRRKDKRRRARKHKKKLGGGKGAAREQGAAPTMPSAAAAVVTDPTADLYVSLFDRLQQVAAGEGEGRPVTGRVGEEPPWLDEDWGDCGVQPQEVPSSMTPFCAAVVAMSTSASPQDTCEYSDDFEVASDDDECR